MHEKFRRFAQERDRVEHECIRRLLAAVLRPDDDCVDVGASSGDVLREIVRYAPRGRHIAFEPVPSVAAALVQAFPTVEIRRSAVGEVPGRAPFFHVVDEPPLSSLRPLPYHAGHQMVEIQVEVEALDSCLPADLRPRLLKLDAEGAEEQILSGGLRTIRRHRPMIVLEYIRDGAGPFGSTPAQLYELLTGGAGMRLFDVFGTGPYDVGTLTRTVHARRVQNFVAYPEPAGPPSIG